MCGVVGIVGTRPVNQALYDALTVMQHRDAVGEARRRATDTDVARALVPQQLTDMPI